MRRLLHLQHHSHSGKLIHHRHTSYRALFVIVALFSVALAFLHQTVRADNLEVFAKVSAQIPTIPASITEPVSGTVVTEMPLTVEGTCEYVAPASIIELYSGANFLGSTPCTFSGTFATSITLSAGTHQLVAKTANITQDYGPDSPAITVTYTPPLAPETPPTQPTTPTTPAGGEQPLETDGAVLIIRSKFTYVTYGPGKDPLWIGTFEGGKSPYTVTVDWGDGTIDTYTNINDSEQSFRHRYKEYVSYFMSITVTDQAGASLTREFAVVTPYAPQQNGFAMIQQPLIDEGVLQTLLYSSLIVLAILSLLVYIHRHPLPQLPNHKSHPRL